MKQKKLTNVDIIQNISLREIWTSRTSRRELWRKQQEQDKKQSWGIYENPKTTNALFELNYNPEEANMKKTRKRREREEEGKEQCSQTILRDQMPAPHARHTPQSQHLVIPVRNSSATLPKHKLPTACNSTCQTPQREDWATSERTRRGT